MQGNDYYVLNTVNSVKEIDSIKYIELKNFNWETDVIYRPKTFAKIFVYDNMLCCKLKCYEENPKAIYKIRDESIWKDSCLEFFVRPVKERAEYINVETNSKGVFLCEYGTGNKGRIFVKELTSLSPIVSSFKGNDENGNFWGVFVRLTKEFIADLFKLSVSDVTFDDIFLNCYKCGDDCEKPHFISLFPVTALPPGFHNPDCFKEFIRKDV